MLLTWISLVSLYLLGIADALALSNVPSNQAPHVPGKRSSATLDDTLLAGTANDRTTKTSDVWLHHGLPSDTTTASIDSSTTTSTAETQQSTETVEESSTGISSSAEPTEIPSFTETSTDTLSSTEPTEEPSSTIEPSSTVELISTDEPSSTEPTNTQSPTEPTSSGPTPTEATSTEPNSTEPTNTESPTEPTDTPSPTEPTDTQSPIETTETPTCSPTDINGSFEDGSIAPWNIANQQTADSHTVNESPDGTGYSFALIPSQSQYAKVELELRLSCGNPPPIVTFDVQFSYLFTDASEGCSISSWVNRNSQAALFTITDDGVPDGEWQTYSSGPVDVQLSYDAVFTIELQCDENTPRESAVLITDVSLF